MMIPNYAVKCKTEDYDRKTLLNLTLFILNNIFNHYWTSFCAVNNNLLNSYAPESQKFWMVYKLLKTHKNTVQETKNKN